MTQRVVRFVTNAQAAKSDPDAQETETLLEVPDRKVLYRVAVRFLKESERKDASTFLDWLQQNEGCTPYTGKCPENAEVFYVS